ncbi:hypothetical protein CAPTEDRAFT_169207 [Capitella teleta]|uniref:Ectonucleoside triphosphate diphosphohydrolase 1 n=1 Tax=Capitella teleta TaxID=283909 RepID=R7VDI5_CAPTE|nr:hypothetical protein CAPTEDRAFT_169207 [Capitella teleta]|eukprot:ELU13730.1 hypothetical protein CAPTEDRAFT_169207 [Capitella teleta]
MRCVVSVLDVCVSHLFLQYSVVVDCGSSHTQFYVYKWEADKENGTAIITEASSCYADDHGISTYVNNPDLAGESLKECLTKAEAVIPPSKQASSPIYLGATAGMRLLRDVDVNSSRAIMQSVRNALSDSAFRFVNATSQARIIDGDEEGAYGWISVNYIAGKFGHFSPLEYFFQQSTVGALDLGGASTQITYVPANDVTLPAEYSKKLMLYGAEYDVYTHSFSCYGLKEAHRRFLAHLVQANNYSTSIVNPCAPSGNVTSLNFTSIFKAPCCHSDNTTAKNLTFHFSGSSDPDKCQTQVEQLFLFNKSCPSCSFNNVYQPALNGEFMAFSGFYYIVKDLNLTVNSAKFPLDEFENAAKQYCQKPWNEVSHLPNVSAAQAVQLCFNAQHMSTLLVKGYDFNETQWESLSFQDKIEGADLGWTVGFMLNTSNSLPAEYPRQRINTALFVLLLLLFIGFLLLSIGFILHSRRVARRNNAEYSRLSSSYGSI